MKHLSILLSTILLLPLSADAQTEAPDSVVTLTLADCRSMALSNNKEIAAREQAARSAAYMVRSARGNLMPNIAARGTGLYSSANGGTSIMGYNIGYEVGTVLTGGISIEQPLYAGGKIKAAYRLAELNRDIAEAGRALTTTEVIEQTDEAYASVVRAGAMVDVAEAYQALLGELGRSVESAYRNGMKPKNDVLKVQVKMNESLLSLRKAENALRLAKMNLCHYIGLPLTTNIAVSDTTGCPNDPIAAAGDHNAAIQRVQSKLAWRLPSVSRVDEVKGTPLQRAGGYADGASIVGATLVVARTRQVQCSQGACPISGRPQRCDSASAIELARIAEREQGRRSQGYAPTPSLRPEYTMLSKQVEAARQDIRVQRAAMLPTVGLGASYDYIHGIEINDRTLMDKGLFSAMLSVSVPLYHFGERTNKVRAAKARLLQAELEWQDMNEKMTLEIVQAANNMDEAALERNIARRSLEQAEENMRVSQRMYDAGMETLSDLLGAQALWQQAYEQTVTADYNLYISRVAYRKAMGTLLGNEE